MYVPDSIVHAHDDVLCYIIVHVWYVWLPAGSHLNEGPGGGAFIQQGKVCHQLPSPVQLSGSLSKNEAQFFREGDTKMSQGVVSLTVMSSHMCQTSLCIRMITSHATSLLTCVSASSVTMAKL